MKQQMQSAQERLRRLLEDNELTVGMYVRVHGDHLIAGRNEAIDSTHTPEPSDRVRFTRLSRNRYGLSVKRHTGRWERTPFQGSIRETVEVVCNLMQHLVALY